MKIFTEFEGIKLSNNENAIVDFIEKHPDEFIKLGIQDLSNKLFISIGSVSRFSKKVGFASFRDLKSFVIKEKIRHESYYNLTQSSKTQDIMHDIKVYNRHTIEKTVDAMNTKVLESTIADIEKSSKVVTYGLGSSSLAASEMANNLNIQGINSVFAPTIHDVVLWLRKRIHKNFVVVIFSKSMSGKDNNFLLSLLLKYKIKVKLITENLKYKSEGTLDVMHIKTLEMLDNEIQISSKISQLFVADVIIQNIKLHTLKENTDLYNEFHREWKNK
ncbi:MAG: MurR/RpiR family transcriptional regulator [Mycoplasmatales bacterium]|nr:MurR/RpiR family transcriptional regulator [Mycoplasmatales bacterium]